MKNPQRFNMALTQLEREKHEAAAKERGISLASFYRLAANEYLQRNRLATASEGKS